MSDRSYATVTFYWCTPADWPKVVECFNQHGGMTVPEDMNEYPKEWPYTITDDEVRLTTLHDILKDVASQTDAIFWGAQDSYFEYLGDLDIQVEEGYFHGEPDNTGSLPMYVEHLTSLIASVDSLEALQVLIDEKAGTKFLKAAIEWRDGVRKPQFVIDEQPTITDDG